MMPRLFGRDWTRADLARRVGHLSQLFGVQAAEYADGPARGMRLLTVRSGGGLTLVLHPDRCLDAGATEYRGVPLSWRSAAGPVHPALAPGGDRAAFQRGFGGGLLVTCGLRHFGPALTTPDEVFPTHGRAHSLPAESVQWGVDWAGDAATIWVQGTVREARAGGEHLELRRRWELPVGGAALRLTDVVTNRGFRPEPLAVLHHLNLGFPLVDDGVAVTLDGRAVAVPGAPGTQSLPTPAGGHVVVRSPLLPLAVAVRFGHPALHLWRQPEPGMNVLGVEPASHAELGRAAPGPPWLAPGESATFDLTITVALPAPCPGR